MQIIVLGSGTGVPLHERGSPSIVLILRDSHPILLDMGPGVLRQLSRLGLRHEEVHRIFLTHFHPDHTADLVPFLFATRYPPVLARREPFIISGPMGLEAFLNKLQKPFGKWIHISPELLKVEELNTRKPEKTEVGDLHLISQPVQHTDASLAYRFETASGANFVFSGDTGFCDEIVDLAEGTDLLILECAFPDGEDISRHLSPATAGMIAQRAKVKKLLLLHFYPEVLSTDIAGQCRKTYTGELILGRDLLHLRIG